MHRPNSTHHKAAAGWLELGRALEDELKSMFQHYFLGV